MDKSVEQKLKDIISNSKTVIAVAAELNVSRQTVHKWLRRYKKLHQTGVPMVGKRKSHSAHNKIPSAIESVVIATAQKYPEAGVAILTAKLLSEYKVALNPATVFRILKRNNVKYVGMQGLKTKAMNVVPVATPPVSVRIKAVTPVPVTFASGIPQVPDAVMPAQVTVPAVQSAPAISIPFSYVSFPSFAGLRKHLSLLSLIAFMGIISVYGMHRVSSGAIALHDGGYMARELSTPQFDTFAHLVTDGLKVYRGLADGFHPLASDDFTSKTFTPSSLAGGLSSLMKGGYAVAKVDLAPVQVYHSYAFGGYKARAAEGALPFFSNKTNLAFLDRASLALFCKVAAISSSLRQERCNYDLVASGLLPASSVVVLGVPVEKVEEPAVATTTVPTEAPVLPALTPDAPTVTQYITKYVTSYVPVVGPAGKDGLAGKDGRNGNDGITLFDATRTYPGYGSYILPPVSTYSPSAPIGVSTIAYLKDTRIEFPNISGGSATNLTLDSSTFNNAVFNGLSLFNDQAVFTGTMVANDLTATSSNFLSATTTNAYVSNLFADAATSTDSYIARLVAASSTLTDAMLTNSTTTNAYVASLVAASSTLTDLVVTNASSTNSTTTNAYIRTLLADYATSTNFFANTAFLTNSTTTVAYIGTLSVGTSTVDNMFLSGILTVQGTSTLATTTITKAIITNASTTNLSADNAALANATSTNFFSNLLNAVTGSFTNLVGGNATTTNLFTQNLAVGNASTTGSQSIDGTLNVNGTSTLGANVFLNGSVVVGTSTNNMFTINALVNSNISPAQNKVYDLGSPSFYWRDIFADNINVNSISAASTTIGGTSNNTFAINTDNVTSDTEDSSLIFFRGLVNPNGILRWSSINKRMESNMSLKIQNETPSTGTTTLTVQGGAGQGSTNLFELLNNAGTKLSVFDANGSLGIGTTTPTSPLVVSSPIGGNITRVTTSSTTSELYQTLTNGGGDTYLGIESSTGGRITVGGLPYATALNTVQARAIQFGTNNTARMTILGTGNVGIATTTPGSALTVTGAGYFTGSLSAEGALFGGKSGAAQGYLRLYNSTNGSAEGNIYNDNTNGGIRMDTASNLYPIQIDGSKLVLGLTGNVGIGTTNPISKLSVDANNTTTGEISTTFISASFPNIRGSFVHGGNGGGYLSAGGLQIVAQGANNTTAGSGNINFLTSGTNSANASTDAPLLNRMTIRYDGNVGVGTTNPSSKLQVSGSEYAGAGDYGGPLTVETTDAAAIGKGGSIVLGGQTGNANPDYAFGMIKGAKETMTAGNYAGYLAFYTVPSASNILERMRIDSNGNVGIGTTNPSYKLEIATTSNSVADLALLNNLSAISAGVRMLFNNGYGNLGAIKVSQMDNGALADDGALELQTASNAVLSTKMTILNSGNVGIGTTVPADTNGYGRALDIRGSTTGNGSAMYVGNSDASVRGFFAGYGDGRVELGSATAHPLKFITNNAERMRIDSTGNVGIGTTNPLTKLHVSGGAGGLPATSGTAPTALLAIENSSSVSSLYFGTDNNSPYASWMQAANSNGLGTYEPLLLNPRGGNVGIGTGAPDAKFHLGSGFARIGATASINVNIDSNQIWALNNGASSDLYLNYSSQGNVLLNSNGGNVGIGTTNPTTNLHIGNTSGGGIRVGAVANAGTLTVPVGSQTAQYNIDFTGYRDAAPDQIGARISALRFNNYLPNNALIQNTGLAFYTNPSGTNTGTTDLVERLRITPTGNVGIGTTAPGTKLVVDNSANAATAAITINSAPGWNSQLLLNVNGVLQSAITAVPSDSSLRIYNNGNDRMTIDSVGNVGIGTTNPIAKLQIQLTGTASLAAATIVKSTDFSAAGRFGFNGLANNSDGVFFGMGADGTGIPAGMGFFREASGWNTAMAFYTNNITSGPNSTAAMQEKMRITSAGNVGIGTTGPSARLTIATPTAYEGDVFKVVSTNEPTAYNLTLNSFSPAGGVVAYSFNTTNSSTAYNSNLVLDRGNVGIGTMNPQAKLDVGGSGNIYIGYDYTGTNQILKAFTTAHAAGNVPSTLTMGMSDGSFAGMSVNNVRDGSFNSQSVSFTTHHGGVSAGVRMTIDKDGNAGIGVTDPAGFKLNIAGTQYVAGQLTVDGFGNDAGLSFRNGFAPTNVGVRAKAIATANRDGLELLGYNGIDFTVNNGSNVAMHINGFSAATGVMGNVGIGMTNPYGKLSIKQSTTDFLGGLYLQEPSTADTWGILGAGGALYFGNAPSASGADNQADFSTRVVIKPDGNVGIGTVTTPYPLTVRGANNIAQLESSAASALLHFVPTGGDAWRIGAGDVNVSDFGIRNMTDGATRLSIDGVGNVGIGVTPAGAKLAVAGEVAISSSAAYNTHFNYLDAGSNYITTANTASTFFRDSGAANVIMTVKGGGGVGIGTTDPTGKLQIASTFANGIFQDSNDRPSVGLTGGYPQMVLMGGGSTNASHGATVVIGAFDAGTSGASKHWSIGTAGQGATFLDFGFSSTDTNPHAGIRNYAGNTVMTMLSSGNVGIGTINPGIATYSMPLTVESASSLGTFIGIRNTDNTLGMGGVWMRPNTTNAGWLFGTDNTGQAIIKYGSAAAEVDALTGAKDGTTGLTITTTGNVGIGTTTPGSLLTVAGTLSLNGVTTLNQTNLEMGRGNGARNGISWYSPSYTAWSQYMAQAGNTGTGPHGDLTAPSGALVTTWGMRNFVENVAGYGWTFESGAAQGQPSVVAEIRSSDGAFRSAATVTGSTGINTGAGIGTNRIDASGNLVNIGTITSGLINGQTISSAANFTGTLVAAGNITSSGSVYWGVSGSRTEAKNDAGAIASKSGFFETSSPTNYYTGASSWQHLIEARHSNDSNNYAMQISGSFFDQDLYFRKTNNDSSTPWNKFIYQNSAGNVGIGTTNPQAKLDVVNAVSATPVTNGIIRIVGSGVNPATGSGGGLLFAQQNSLGAYQSYGSITGRRVNASLNNLVDLDFNTGSPTDGVAMATRMTITNAGNVGIGTTTPGATLTVAGTITSTGAITTNGNITASNGIISGNNITSTGYAYVASSLNVSGGIYDNSVYGIHGYYLQQSFATSCAISVDSAGLLGCTSDERLKDLHGFYQNGLEAIDTINPIRFNYKNDPYIHVGFSAQNVGEVLPEATPLQKSGYMGFDSNAVLALVVNGAKELSFKRNTDSMTVALYEADDAVDAGTVVAFSDITHEWSDGTASTTASSTPVETYQLTGIRKASGTDAAIGIVTTFSTSTIQKNGGKGVPVLSSGRVAIKVTAENGEVKAGDYLTVSLTRPGYAMKLTGEGLSLGRALSNHVPGTEKVLAVIENGYLKLDMAGKFATTTGMLTTGNVDLNANGVSIINIKSLASANGTWSIDEGGRIIAKMLCLNTTCISEEQLINILTATNQTPQAPATSSSTASSTPGSSGATVAGTATTTETGTTTPVTIEPASTSTPVATEPGTLVEVPTAVIPEEVPVTAAPGEPISLSGDLPLIP